MPQSDIKSPNERANEALGIERVARSRGGGSGWAVAKVKDSATPEKPS